jgi:hypothetical protein
VLWQDWVSQHSRLIFRLPFAIRARIVCGTPADYPFRKPGGRIAPTEVLVRLVAASVFKTAGLSVNRSAGGFDSHALPPFFACRVYERSEMHA